MKIKFLILISVVTLCGCEACPHYNRLQVANFNGAGAVLKKPYGTVTPFQTADEVKRPYKVIAFMSCEASVGDEGAILKAMLYRSADLGADAIILNPNKISGETLSNGANNINVKWGWMALIGNGNNAAYRAQAIEYATSTAP
jgi:hypothetical protein